MIVYYTAIVYLGSMTGQTIENSEDVTDYVEGLKSENKGLKNDIEILEKRCMAQEVYINEFAKAANETLGIYIETKKVWLNTSKEREGRDEG